MYTLFNMSDHCVDYNQEQDWLYVESYVISVIWFEIIRDTLNEFLIYYI